MHRGRPKGTPWFLYGYPRCPLLLRFEQRHPLRTGQVVRQELDQAQLLDPGQRLHRRKDFAHRHIISPAWLRPTRHCKRPQPRLMPRVSA